MTLTTRPAIVASCTSHCTEELCHTSFIHQHSGWIVSSTYAVEGSHAYRRTGAWDDNLPHGRTTDKGRRTNIEAIRQYGE